MPLVSCGPCCINTDRLGENVSIYNLVSAAGDSLRSSANQSMDNSCSQTATFVSLQLDMCWFSVSSLVGLCAHRFIRKYHPTSLCKLKDENEANLKKRLEAFQFLLHSGRLDNIPLSTDCSDKVMKVMDAGKPSSGRGDLVTHHLGGEIWYACVQGSPQEEKKVEWQYAVVMKGWV